MGWKVFVAATLPAVVQAKIAASELPAFAECGDDSYSLDFSNGAYMSCDTFCFSLGGFSEAEFTCSSASAVDEAGSCSVTPTYMSCSDTDYTTARMCTCEPMFSEQGGCDQGCDLWLIGCDEDCDSNVNCDAEYVDPISNGCMDQDCVGAWGDWVSCPGTCFDYRVFLVSSPQEGAGSDCGTFDGDVEFAAPATGGCTDLTGDCFALNTGNNPTTTTAPTTSQAPKLAGDCDGDWSEWQCDCKSNMQFRTFDVVSRPLPGGEQCEVADNTVESLACTTDACVETTTETASGEFDEFAQAACASRTINAPCNVPSYQGTCLPGDLPGVLMCTPTSSGVPSPESVPPGPVVRPSTPAPERSRPAPIRKIVPTPQRPTLAPLDDPSPDIMPAPLFKPDEPAPEVLPAPLFQPFEPAPEEDDGPSPGMPPLNAPAPTAPRPAPAVTPGQALGDIPAPESTRRPLYDTTTTALPTDSYSPSPPPERHPAPVQSPFPAPADPAPVQDTNLPSPANDGPAPTVEWTLSTTTSSVESGNPAPAPERHPSPFDTPAPQVSGVPAPQIFELPGPRPFEPSPETTIVTTTGASGSETGSGLVTLPSPNIDAPSPVTDAVVFVPPAPVPGPSPNMGSVPPSSEPSPNVAATTTTATLPAPGVISPSPGEAQSPASAPAPLPTVIPTTVAASDVATEATEEETTGGSDSADPCSCVDTGDSEFCLVRLLGGTCSETDEDCMSTCGNCPPETYHACTPPYGPLDAAEKANTCAVLFEDTSHTCDSLMTQFPDAGLTCFGLEAFHGADCSGCDCILPVVESTAAGEASTENLVSTATTALSTQTSATATTTAAPTAATTATTTTATATVSSSTATTTATATSTATAHSTSAMPAPIPAPAPTTGMSTSSLFTVSTTTHAGTPPLNPCNCRDNSDAEFCLVKLLEGVCASQLSTCAYSCGGCPDAAYSVCPPAYPALADDDKSGTCGSVFEDTPYTCDTLMLDFPDAGLNCAVLESSYGVDCSGCLCNSGATDASTGAPASTASTDTTTTATTKTTTNGELSTAGPCACADTESSNFCLGKFIEGSCSSFATECAYSCNACPPATYNGCPSPYVPLPPGLGSQECVDVFDEETDSDCDALTTLYGTSSGLTCAMLESVWGLDCSGCACLPPVVCADVDEDLCTEWVADNPTSCDTLFCPTCSQFGLCDKTCDMCSTTTTTPTTDTTTAQDTTTSAIPVTTGTTTPSQLASTTSPTTTTSVPATAPAETATPLRTTTSLQTTSPAQVASTHVLTTSTNPIGTTQTTTTVAPDIAITTTSSTATTTVPTGINNPVASNSEASGDSSVDVPSTDFVDDDETGEIIGIVVASAVVVAIIVVAAVLVARRVKQKRWKRALHHVANDARNGGDAGRSTELSNIITRHDGAASLPDNFLSLHGDAPEMDEVDGRVFESEMNRSFLQI